MEPNVIRPDEVKTGQSNKIVADITARDALETSEGLITYVVDATADNSVDSGGATYIYENEQWTKFAEFESLDLLLNTIGAPSGNVNLNSQKIINLADPTSNQDAATKKYVDGNAGDSRLVTVEEYYASINSSNYQTYWGWSLALGGSGANNMVLFDIICNVWLNVNNDVSVVLRTGSYTNVQWVKRTISKNGNIIDEQLFINPFSDYQLSGRIADTEYLMDIINDANYSDNDTVNIRFQGVGFGDFFDPELEFKRNGSNHIEVENYKGVAIGWS